MKKRRGKIFGAVVLFTAMALALTGCGDGASGGGGGGGPIVISGVLSSEGGPASSVLVKGRAVAPEATTQEFRAEVGGDGKTLAGKLRDGSIVFELTGLYNADTKEFSMQAPSSLMIFSIAGKLNASNTIDTSATIASVNIKDPASGEWAYTSLSINGSTSVTVVEEPNANMTDVTRLPVYCRGEWMDQISAQAYDGARLMVTANSIVYSEDDLPYPIILDVVEVKNANGSPVDDNGPWEVIVNAEYSWYNPTGEVLHSVPYTARFYVSKTFDAKLTAGIGGSSVNDLFWGQAGSAGEYTISQAISSGMLPGVKFYVAPYCDKVGVYAAAGDLYPDDDYSPMFTGPNARANALTATSLKAKSEWTFAFAPKQ